jgi:hypothetical protein
MRKATDPNFREPALNADLSVIPEKPVHFVPVPEGEQALDDEVAVALRINLLEVEFLKEGSGGGGDEWHESIIQHPNHPALFKFQGVLKVELLIPVILFPPGRKLEF